MTVTLFGALIGLIGVWLLAFGSTTGLLIFAMLATLFGGSAAITLETGSSIAPAILAVLFLALRCILPSQSRSHPLGDALRANAALVVFALYGAVGAFILPFLFAGAIEVTPLRPIITHDPFAVFPLAFSVQNITTAGYVLTTMLAAIGAFVAVQYRGAGQRVVNVTIAMTFTHALLGFASVVAAGTPFEIIFDFIRNGSYNQLSQQIGGYARMSGVFAEASNFAAYGVALFVLMTEFWLRDIRPRWTGPAALLMLAAIAASTSSTGYAGLAGYAVILLLRQLVVPQSIPPAKSLPMVATLVTGASAILVAGTLRPNFGLLVGRIYAAMIADKLDSVSGMVRLMWARQGVEAFWVSRGLGVGVGSFRSSSLGTAILGSLGVIGTLAYAAQMLRVIKPLRRSTYLRTGDLATDLSASTAWVAIAIAIPAFVGSPTPDPGLVWGIVVGLSLGFDHAARARGAEAPVDPRYLRTIV